LGIWEGFGETRGREECGGVGAAGQVFGTRSKNIGSVTCWCFNPEIWKFDTQLDSLASFDTQFDDSSKINTLSTNFFKKRDLAHILSYSLYLAMFTFVKRPNCP
jgi:hypothetical protein